MSEWEDRAACRAAVLAGTADPDWWFPSGDQATMTSMARRALAICNRCPVVDECFAAHHDAPAGIFGGQGERRRLGGRQGHRPRLERSVVVRTCAECDRTYTAEPQSRSIVCSDKCLTDRRRRQMREYHEERTGRIPDHAGSISRYNKGCRCSRCREAARKARRVIRERQVVNA